MSVSKTWSGTTFGLEFRTDASTGGTVRPFSLINGRFSCLNNQECYIHQFSFSYQTVKGRILFAAHSHWFVTMKIDSFSTMIS